MAAACLVACGADNGDSAANNPSGPGSGPLLDVCTGQYVCKGTDGSEIKTTLSKRDGSCYAGSQLIPPSGTATTSNGVLFTWSGDASKWDFALASDGVALKYTCVPSAGTPPPTTAAGMCTGTPQSCSYGSPPNCSRISGCSMRSKLKWDGSWENYCDGVPDLCHESYGEASCKEQGCTWK